MGKDKKDRKKERRGNIMGEIREKKGSRNGRDTNGAKRDEEIA